MRLYKIFFLCAVFAILFSASPVSALTEVTDSIDVDTTWVLSESPYVVENTIGILGGATLTIEPGVVVKFGDMASLYVDGVLDASGTVAGPIIFTSDKDDSVGGDTNGDGVGTSPSESDWNALSFGNIGTASTLSHIEIHFASQGVLSFGSSLFISDAVIKYVYQGMLFFEGVTTIKNISFLNIGRSAIDLYDGATVDADTVSLTGLGEYGDSISMFGNSFLTLKNASFAGSLGSDGISVYEGSDVNIDTSIFSGFDTAISDYGSGNLGPDSIKVQNSQIKNNDVGFAFYANNSTLSIIKNSIHSNTIFGAESYSTSNINLKNNFWGDASGPFHPDTNSSGLGNAIFDIPGYSKILFTPWLTSWPSEPAPCCSSVIFVPGFEGSRLYEKNNKGKLTQRWEPGIASLTDVKSLFMDKDGNSVKDNIVTKDVIETTNYPIFNVEIYKSISNFLKIKKEDQVIDDFFSFPYDWRFDISNIAQNGTQTNTEVIKLKDKIISLANNSKTDKVTLVGHSNGGLLIKKTVELLKLSGQSNLVDKVILVASPQLGTPQAFGALLHGYKTSIGAGFILDPEVARLWGQNMPGVYGLLPSEKLYEKIGSFVNFKSSLSNNWHDLYGDTLDYSEQANFLSGLDGRKQPKDDDLDNPTILRQSILNKATSLHQSIDNLDFPANIEVHEIAGVGKYTLQGITYQPYAGFGPVSYKPNISCDGDKTVIPASAVDKNENPYYLDLYDYYKDNGGEFDHVNIMENPEIINLISNLVTDSTNDTTHISSSKPSMEKCRFKFLGMFSPADLDIYDGQGRHVGINREKSTNNFQVFDTDIPGSDFFTIGDKKFAIVPDEGEFTVKIDGTGTGLYTLAIATQENGEVIHETSFADLPVTPSLQGSMVVDTQSQDEPILTVDTNGDGVVDQEILPNYGASPLSYLEVVRVTIIELELSKKLEKSLLQQINRVITLVKKNKIDKATDKLQKFLKRIDIGHKIAKEMTPAEKEDLANKINNFLIGL